VIPAGRRAWILIHKRQVTQAHGRHLAAIADERAAELHRSDGILAHAIGALAPCKRRVARTPIAETKDYGTVEDIDPTLIATPGNSAQLVDFQEELALAGHQDAVKPARDALKDNRVVIQQGARAKARANRSDLGGQARAVAGGPQLDAPVEGRERERHARGGALQRDALDRRHRGQPCRRCGDLCGQHKENGGDRHFVAKQCRPRAGFQRSGAGATR
jgi:hypothetical protein